MQATRTGESYSSQGATLGPTPTTPPGGRKNMTAKSPDSKKKKTPQHYSQIYIRHPVRSDIVMACACCQPIMIFQVSVATLTTQPQRHSAPPGHSVATLPTQRVPPPIRWCSPQQSAASVKRAAAQYTVSIFQRKFISPSKK